VNGSRTNLSGSLRRPTRTALIAAALVVLAVGVVVALVSSKSGRSVPVAAALEPVPEGPAFRISRGDAQWSELSIPARPPEPVPQTCEAGLNVVLILGDETRVVYGPCRRPRVIELLRADLLSVARNRDLRASVGSTCGKRVLSDWFDNGRVDRRYRRACYERALDLLPEGMEDIGQAEATIRTALCAWFECRKKSLASETRAESQAAPTRTRGEHAAGWSLGLLCPADAEKPPCGPGARVGRDYDYVLYTHCGIEWAIFDGRLWLARPALHDEGVRGAPSGWGDPTQSGVMRLLGAARAEFRAGLLTAAFTPAPAGSAREACD